MRGLAMFRACVLTALCLSIGSSARAELVGYWPFNGNSLDQSTLGNHGELFGGVYSNNVPAVLGAGQSLSFEDPFDHVFVDANESLNARTFTLSMFINDQGQFEGINRFTSRESDTFETGLDKVFGTDSISYYSPSAGWVRTGFVPEIDAWHHLAYVADGSEMTVYVDGELSFGPVAFAAAPAGFLHIGNRWNDVEGFFGMMDDVAMWSVPLPETSIAELASGAKSPLEIPIPEPPTPPPAPFLSVATNVDSWKQSTESTDGGLLGDWDWSGDPDPPSAATFTLDVLPTEPGVVGHINAAATFLDVQGLQADNDTHYYRTTFQLDRTSGVTAELQLAVDNGAQVYINGELVGIEASFVVENWSPPLPSLTFASDGSVEGTKFDVVADSFSGWIQGENEIMLAVRNPFEETAPAGGFALRLDFFSDTARGDFNGDGMIDAADIDLLNAAIRGDQAPAFDLTGDGAVNGNDRDEMIRGVIGTWYGDSNLDGEFSSADLVAVFSAGKDESFADAGWAEGDWNGDRVFNSGDLVTAFSDGGYEVGPRPAAAVPEPVGAWLVLVGLGITGCYGRRYRSRIA
jgi:hypothetical protein